jgi:uncharacterized protein
MTCIALRNRIQSMFFEFKKPFYSFGGHGETILSKSQPALSLKTWTLFNINVAKQNTVSVRHSPLKENILFILHGLGSDWSSSENMWSASAAIELGWCVAQIQWARRPPTHAGQIDHLEKAIQKLGFSMGASVMLNWARKQSLARAQKLIGVSPLLDLESTSTCLTRGFSRLYDYRFNKILRSWYPESNIKSEMTIREVDEVFTSRFHGFKNRNDYYQSCSALNFIDEIQIPQIFLSAQNDTLVTADTFEKIKPSPLRKIILTEGGGHVGYGHRMADFIKIVLS